MKMQEPKRLLRSISAVLQSNDTHYSRKYHKLYYHDPVSV